MAYISNKKFSEILEKLACYIEKEAATPEEAASIIRKFIIEANKRKEKNYEQKRIVHLGEKGVRDI